ncbi:histidine phosphatase family protein [Schumannella soli]|uniref:Histidine phosphatase family protein n=1 Tax=Schumannella soli TaxID=2590779 RepID=A0A506XV85_9MICO|nr:histidine phosphatase family protein [Schumannella soli]
MRLLLVRHGETVLNARGVLDAVTPGAPLSARGRRQALELVDRLADEPIALLCHSSMVRTRMTVQPLATARGLEPVLIAGAEEIGAGDLQGAADPARIRRYLETAFAWSDGDLGPRVPGGEDGVEFFRRFDTAIADMAHRLRSTRREGASGSAVLVTHSAAIRVWVARRGHGLADGFSARRPLANTGIVVVESVGDHREWRVVSWDDVGTDAALPPSADLRDDPQGSPLGPDAPRRAVRAGQRSSSS